MCMGANGLGWRRFKLVYIHPKSLEWRGCMCIDAVAFQSSKMVECRLHRWHGSLIHCRGANGLGQHMSKPVYYTFWNF